MIKAISYPGLYEPRFAELLELFESHERKSIASSEHVNARQ
jgi:hypothetical protein